jgi:hypothetical protein
MDDADIRVGDAERRQVADALQQHFVAGRLTSEELTERVERAMAARTRGDLAALQQDLPPLAPVAAPEPSAAAPRAPEPAPAGWPTDVRTHAGGYAVVIVMLVVIWLLTTPGGYFWPIWPMLGWGVAVALHALARRPG